MKKIVTLGEVRLLIQKVSTKYANEKNIEKKEEIEKTIGSMIVCIKKELGDFSVVAHNSNSINTQEILSAYQKMVTYLQE